MFTNISVLIIASFAIGAALGLCTVDESHAINGCAATSVNELRSLMQAASSGALSGTQACKQAASSFDQAKQCLAPYQQNCTKIYSGAMHSLIQTYGQDETYSVGCSGHSDGTCNHIILLTINVCMSEFTTNNSALAKTLGSGDDMKTYTCGPHRALVHRSIKCFDGLPADNQACTHFKVLKDTAASLQKACGNSRGEETVDNKDISSGSSLYSVFYVTFFCLILTGVIS